MAKWLNGAAKQTLGYSGNLEVDNITEFNSDGTRTT
jgi:hypothetical protein